MSTGQGRLIPRIEEGLDKEKENLKIFVDKS